MVKADRYTEDGCEAITKAREADVEDRTYQIGEISQKTGLQKTAEGWVKPKSGNSAGGAKKEVDKKLAKEIANSNHFEEQQKVAKKAKRDEELHRQRAEGEANAEAYRKRYEEEHKEEKHSLENAKKMAESYRKTSNKPIYITEKDGDYIVAKGRDELEYARENGYKLVPSTPYPNRKLVSKISSNEDSAPRQLTGDCKITIKG